MSLPPNPHPVEVFRGAHIPVRSYPLFLAREVLDQLAREADSSRPTGSFRPLPFQKNLETLDMNLQLHKNARTTPAIRRKIQAQPASIRNNKLAKLYNIHRHTVAKRRQREHIVDASSRPHTFHTTLSAAQEQTGVALRKTLLLPLDDLLAVIP